MPVAGVKSSAVASVPVPFIPPVIKTFPLASLVAWCIRRANDMLPVAVKLSTATHADESARTTDNVSDRNGNVLDFTLTPFGEPSPKDRTRSHHVNGKGGRIRLKESIPKKTDVKPNLWMEVSKRFLPRNTNGRIRESTRSWVLWGAGG